MKELEWLLGKWTTEVREVEESSHGPSYHELKSITVSLAKSRDRLEVRYTYINMPRFDERTYFKFVETIHQDGKRWKKNTSWRKRKGYANVAGGKTSGYLEKTAEGTWTGASVGPYLGRTRPRSIRLKRLNQNQFVYNWNGVEFVCTRDESAKP